MRFASCTSSGFDRCLHCRKFLKRAQAVLQLGHQEQQVLMDAMTGCAARASKLCVHVEDNVLLAASSSMIRIIVLADGLQAHRAGPCPTCVFRAEVVQRLRLRREDAHQQVVRQFCPAGVGPAASRCDLGDGVRDGHHRHLVASEAANIVS